MLPTVRGPVVQRAVATWAGTFDTYKYDTELDKAKNPIGVGIKLRFMPGKHVDAEKLGIVQMVTSKDKGKPVALDPTVGARSIPAGKAGEGAHIDRLKERANPLYGTVVTGAGDTLATTAAGGNAQHGWRYTDKAGKLHKHDAWIKDTPALPGHGASASQIFVARRVGEPVARPFRRCRED